jgi:hypothetical protein
MGGSVSITRQTGRQGGLTKSSDEDGSGLRSTHHAYQAAPRRAWLEGYPPRLISLLALIS